MEEDANLPFHLKGNYAPVADEKTSDDLPVEGAIPPELSGVYMRNGPNPHSGTSSHWFTGDGMLHAVRLENGRAASYRNRWVQTRPLHDPDLPLISEEGVVDLTVAVANTNIVRHAGDFLALVESSLPTRVNAELETLGLHDYGGRLKTPMTAHPKTCPKTGELHFFGYGFFEPYLVYHRVDSGGTLIQSEVIDVHGPTMVHDFAITENHVVFMDLPIVFDLERAMNSVVVGEDGSPETEDTGMPYHWSDDYPARLGVMPRGQPGAKVRWFEIEPCYVFHPYNAHQQGNTIILDVCRYPEMWRDSSANFTQALPHRFTIDLNSGSVREENLFSDAVEFPRIDDRLVGSKARYGYVVETNDITRSPSGTASIIRHDLERGNRNVWQMPLGSVPSEACFAPAGPGSGEEEGWLLLYAYDGNRKGSDLVILDAAHLEAGPVARIGLPQRVPFGFHGNWFADKA